VRGFTLIELSVVLALVALLTGVALPGHRAQLQRAGRADAVEALTRLQVAQERHRAGAGWYASDLSALGLGAASPQGRYAIALLPDGAEGYRARAEARGAQAGDSECAVLTLDVTQGIARSGPSARCWNR
jgi:type IV pilus assembly protein PilE